MVANMRASSNGDRRSASSNGPPTVRRWDGASRLSTEWNQLRRDPELWIETGDCIVHLAPPGKSKRGPSFLVPLVALRGTKLATQARPVNLEQRQPWDDEGSFARLQMRYSDDDNSQLSELFLPAPHDCGSEQLLEWHLTTRNFFAFILKKSLVGRSLGRAFTTLQRRLEFWRPYHRNNLDDLLAYARLVGYMAFAHCPDFALAMLSVAEQNRNDNLWIDAFAHSVGMEDMLFISDEHQNVSKPTKLYIKNYAISMHGRLQRATKSLSCFLEDDFSPAYLGINDSARAHLNQFQQFLREFYAQKFGHWPPRTLFSKSIFKSMHSDFSNLHDYLVDVDSSADLSEQGLASGGICVLQVVQAFDKRNTYEPLDHPLCRLPADGGIRRSSSKKALVALGLGDKVEVDPQTNVLTKAANMHNTKAISSPLVKAYQRFESRSLQEYRDKLPLTDARKIRWILVYCTLQVLASVMQAPLAVCDTDTNYPLCCDTEGLPPWSEQRPPPSSAGSFRPKSSGHDTQAPLSINDVMQSTPVSRHEQTRSPPRTLKSRQSDISPDCQQDDYIKHMEIPIPSWKDVLSMRDPSTIAIRKMKKQMESDPSSMGKYKYDKSNAKKSSKYSFNMLGSKKPSKSNGNSEREREKELQRQQARNTMGPPPMPPATLARHTSSSTGHSSTPSSKSDAATAVPNRVDSTRTAAPPIRAASHTPLSKISHPDLRGRAYGAGYVEPKSPGKAEVAPWEAMEPSMSGAIAHDNEDDDDDGDDDINIAAAAASSSSSTSAAAHKENTLSSRAGKGKQQARGRQKSVPLMP